MHSEEWAARLLRELTSPRDVLRWRKYWTPVFLAAYLDRVAEATFRDPPEGLRYAKVAPALALLVPEAAGADGRRQHREGLVRAHAALAGAYRAAGRHAAAAAEYEKAEKIAAGEALSPIARADLDNRRAALLALRNRFAEALDLVNAAETAYRTAGDRRRLAEAYAVRGYVLAEARQFDEAIPWHGRALTLALSERRAALNLPKAKRNRAEIAALTRVAESARANLAYDCAHSSDLELVAKADGYIRAALVELKGRRRSLTRHLLEWSQGRLYERLMHHARAEARYKVARRGFVRLGAPWEMALCSLDLAALHLLCREWEPAAALAADTFERFSELAADHEAIASLWVWVEAVEAGEKYSTVEAAIIAAREKIEAKTATARPRA